MKWLDRYLQRKRFISAEPFIQSRSSLMDIGCNAGEFFVYLKTKNVIGIGFDPMQHVDKIELPSGVTIYRTPFPEKIPDARQFDAVSALAVVEHFPPETIENFIKLCKSSLKPGGLIILTIPSPLVDPILRVLRFFRLIIAGSLEEHHGFNPEIAVKQFSHYGLYLKHRRRFELGLNNLFVFQKPEE